MTLINPNKKIGLLTETVGYDVSRYPWAYDAWKQQQKIHWMPEEIPLADDVADWKNKLTDQEKNFLTQIFRFFTQGDIEVNDCYMEHYLKIFKPLEVRNMLVSFSNMETVHVDAYALLLTTLGFKQDEFQAFLKYEEMAQKHDYMGQFGVDTEADVARTLAMFGGFTEGLQLFASFAMLMNFPRHNKMKGMGQVVTWSVRDETLHTESIIKLYKEWTAETQCLTQSVKDDIVDCCKTVVDLEDNFIDLAFELEGIEGMTPEGIKKYIRYIADWRLSQLGLPTVYGIKDHPLPWLVEILNGVEHANFFEARATEYSKSSVRGNFSEVWAALDAKKSA